MSYWYLKQFHMALAIVSICGFILRWIWQMRGSALRNHRITRISPHVVDTLLLIAGVVLAVMTSQYPWSQAWLAAKIGGLVVYIGLGMAAMSLQSRAWQTLAFGLAVLVFAWMLSVARTRTAFGFWQVLI